MTSKTRERIVADMRISMKTRDEVRLRTLRLVESALQRQEIDSKAKESGLSETAVIEVLQKQAKQRREAIEKYAQANRDELVAREKEELSVIAEYLPEQLSDAEIGSIVGRVVSETGATNMSDMGRVMGVAMKELKGKADGKRVQQIVVKTLSSQES